MAEWREGELLWSDDPLWPQFAATHAEAPDAVALIDCADRVWTRADLAALAERHAAALVEAGVRPGMRVLAAGAKHAGTVALALAVSRCGAVFCPYSPKLSDIEQQALEQRLGHVVHGVAFADGALTLLPAPADARPTDIDDAVLIGFTSGSTGLPKAVRHGAGALNYATRGCAHMAGLGAGGAILGIVPLDSAPGFTFTVHFALSQGRSLVLVDPWDPLVAMRRAVRHDCVWAIMVPTHLYTMVEAARSGAWSGHLPLRAAAVGGSAMTAELIANAERLLGLRALRMFGMSECMGHCSTRPDDPIARRQFCDGMPFPGTEEEAFGPDGGPLSRGERGQAGVRGPSLFLGYADGLGAGEERLTSAGFYLTGDEIVRDADGYVTVVGRIKDQIIRGGFNIDPAEVEAALLRHPAVAEIAVVAIPERKLGEQACAVCRLRAGATFTFDTMLSHLEQEGLSRKKWPEHLLLVEQMAVGATGKLDKKAMAATAAARMSASP